MLMTVSRRYVRDEATAKDILQESLLKIFKHIDSYKNTGSFEAWMRTITVRCALAYLDRKDVRRETSITNMSIDISSEAPVLGNLHSEEIIALIQKLPDGFRSVFNLNVLEGYSHKEISVMLNITESASRSQLTRARKVLQKLYQEQNRISKNRKTCNISKTARFKQG